MFNCCNNQNEIIILVIRLDRGRPTFLPRSILLERIHSSQVQVLHKEDICIHRRRSPDAWDPSSLQIKIKSGCFICKMYFCKRVYNTHIIFISCQLSTRGYLSHSIHIYIFMIMYTDIYTFNPRVKYDPVLPSICLGEGVSHCTTLFHLKCIPSSG